uniref:Oxidoreductase BOA1 n=1 Tax=Botryotinia fuckeliana (strain B05.10) TaxID=332648 RepID=BOA1_BOTFB|nr:RecName: Full=Oxidoreductase BOA1; AltName: Full=Botcinic acid biosynthesis cluster A protein 1 [Botrytis cinerea B05.10]CAP58784.1 hypothetical protein [Botrytis cinerea]
MVRVAVAGGTGGVGYAIVDALKAQTEHEFIVLSRTESPEYAAKNNVKVVSIDYSDVSQISKILDEHHIHTVISALCIVSKEHSDSQLNLVRGAAGSQSVKRFVPSEYGSAYEEKHALARPSTGLKAVAVKELAKTHLEYTSFVNGLFLDYLCMPTVPSHLAAGIRFFDIPSRTSVGIGSGTVPLVMTHTRDVGRFVVASLSLPKWENRSFIVGDRQSWHDVINIAGKITGEKWPSLRPSKSSGSHEPAHRAAYSASLKEHGDWFESGTFSSTLSSGSVYLNELFPEIIPSYGRRWPQDFD